MNLLVCGINHQTAPLALRERTHFAPAEVPELLTKLVNQQAANEAVGLFTCNRTDFYLHGADPERLNQLLQSHPKLNDSRLRWYQYHNESALVHMLRVPIGLDSMLTGEPQIFGQFKSAFELARQTGTVKQNFERLFQQIFSYSKLIRHQTEIGKNAISLSYIAIKLIKNIFADIKRCRALLVGAGEMIELIATHLQSAGVKHITIANRDIHKAEMLAQKISAQAIGLSEIPAFLAETEILITATASELPIIGKGAIERALKIRKHRPIFMLDAAVPRDIEPEAKDLEDVYLYSMDDLKEIIEKNQLSRQEQAKQAEEMVAVCAEYLMRKMASLEASEVIAKLRNKIQTLSYQELNKAQALLKQGRSIEDILAVFANNLTNKILHAPSVNLRQAAENKRKDVLLAAEDLFDL